MPGDRVQILVHPQSIAHGMVVFTDGSVKMQAAAPDMRLPIGYALAYPDRLEARGAMVDALVAVGGHAEAQGLRYDFERPDWERFPCVRLAYEALAAGGTMPAVLSAANEIAVAAFVEGEIRFGEIPAVIETTMSRAPAEELSLDGVRRADRSARERAREAVARLRCTQEV
jgi:1-deoxy-D-xylulose-5-phosphate reductoisomerase